MEALYEYQLDSGGNARITRYLGTEAEVTVPSVLDGHRVTAIGEGAFKGMCKETLKRICISEGVSEIEDYAFSGSKALKAVFLPDSVTALGSGLFHFCSELEEICLPAGLTGIPDNAFYGCRSLKTLRLPDTVSSIGKWAFNKCEALQSLKIPDGVTKIGYSAFCDAGLKKICLPKGLRKLEERLFWKCGKLREVQLNEGLSVIGKGAFEECAALKELRIPNSVTRIEGNAFSRCKATIYIPKSVRDIDQWAFCIGITVVGEKGSVAEHRCKTYHNLFLDQNAQLLRDNGMVFQINPDGTARLVKCQAEETMISIPEKIQGYLVTEIGDGAMRGNKSVQRLSIPESITRIGKRAFKDCTGLTDIAFPSGIRDIPEQVCEYCSALKMVQIPEGVRSIGTRAFCVCEGLKKITLPASITSIGEGAFCYCHSLQEISLPEGMQELPASVFSDCRAVQTIRLPRSMTKIGRKAFYNCKSLTTVYIPGSIQSIGEQAFGEDFESPRKLRILTEDPQRVMAASEGRLLASIVKESGEGPGLLFALNSDGTADVQKWDSEEKTVTIPAFFHGHRVVGIRKGAFRNCRSLREVRICEGVTRIEDGAFYGCLGLKHVELPRSITEIADNAFEGCWNLGIQDNSAQGQTVVDSYYHVTYALRKDGAYVAGYSGGRGLIEILATCNGRPVIGIDPRVFRGDRQLKQVWIRDGVREIGAEAFAGCTSLYELKIPSSVTRIGDGAIPKNGPMKMLDPYSAYALQQDPWSRKEYGVYDPVEPEFIERSGITVITSPGSCAARYCKANGIACKMK